MHVTDVALDDILAALPIGRHPLLARAIPIARKRAVDPVTFAREHLAGDGLPVILDDAMDGWPACGKWSFDFFRERYGEDEILANQPMFLEPDLGMEPVQARMRLADYIDYIRDPSQAPLAEFVLGDLATLRRNRLPLYAPVYRVLQRHPELAADVCDSALYCVDDLHKRLPARLREFLDTHGSPVHYLFFAPRDSVAFLHTDYWATHAYLAQLAGRKLCLLFSPADSAHVYHGRVRNPFVADLAQFPDFADATPHIAVLEAGQTAFIPAGWWHFVIGLEPSLTYSYNFFTSHNMPAYVSHLLEALTGAVVEPAGLRPELARALAELHAATVADNAA